MQSGVHCIFISFCREFIRNLQTLKNMDHNFCNIIYKSLDSVLEHLKKKEFENLGSIKTLLDIYENVVKENPLKTNAKKFPLIVLEGLDGCGKSTISKRVSEQLNAYPFSTPPPCIKGVRADFDNPEYKEVRTAYYALGNYIAALEMNTILQSQPVVLDRFWHSTAAYAIAQAIADYPDSVTLPEQENPIYNWPEDLLQPALIVFLRVNERVRLERLKNRLTLTDQENLLKHQEQFRSNVVKAYNAITPKMTLIDGQQSKAKTTELVMVHVRPKMAAMNAE